MPVRFEDGGGVELQPSGPPATTSLRMEGGMLRPAGGSFTHSASQPVSPRSGSYAADEQRSGAGRSAGASSSTTLDDELDLDGGGGADPATTQSGDFVASLASGSSEGGSAYGGASSSGASSIRRLNGKGKGGGCPFYVYAMLAMAVPVVALLAYAGLGLHPILSDMVLIEQEKGTLVTARRCATAAAAERDAIGAFVVTTGGPLHAYEAAVLTSARADFTACLDELRPQLRQTALRRGGDFVEAADGVATLLRGLVHARSEVDRLAVAWAAAGHHGSPASSHASTHEAIALELRAQRGYFTRLDEALLRPLTATERALYGHAAAAFAELVTVATLHSYVGLADGIGAEIVAEAEAALLANLTVTMTPQAFATAAEQREFLAAYGEAIATLRVAYMTVSPAGEAELKRWAGDGGAGGAALAQLSELGDDPTGVAVTSRLLGRNTSLTSGGSSGAHHTRRASADGSNSTPNTSSASERWEHVAHAAAASLDAIDGRKLHEVTSATGELAMAAIVEGIKALVGLVMCAVAAAVLARQQARISAKMDSQLAHVSRMQKAVAAFVPRVFLASMGYTSITQVAAGTCTQVATSLLFADIKAFTTIAEGMPNEELFEWVQGYFARATRVVEAARGNVNLFIGDALFAVFKAPRDALLCAVDMQTDVDKHNLDALKNDANSTPVSIGIGVHHAVVAMGILGDARRHTCTMISSAVNLASRLEGLTRHLHCRVLASDALVSLLAERERRELRLRRLGPAMVKGSATPVVVHEVFQCDERAMQLYKSATRDAFERFTAKLMPDSPVASPSEEKNGGDHTEATPASDAQTALPPPLATPPVPADPTAIAGLQEALEQTVDDVTETRKRLANMRIPAVAGDGSGRSQSLSMSIPAQELARFGDSDIQSCATTPGASPADLDRDPRVPNSTSTTLPVPPTLPGMQDTVPANARHAALMGASASALGGSLTQSTLRRCESTASPASAAHARRRVADRVRRLVAGRGDTELLALFDALATAQEHANVYDATVPAVVVLGSVAGVLRPGQK